MTIYPDCSKRIPSTNFDFRYATKILGLIFLAILFSWAGELLKIPIPWLLIPICVGIVWIVIQPQAKALPKSFSILGQSIIAIATASHFSADTFANVQDYFFPLLICIIVTAAFSLFNGYIIYRWADIDLATSFFSCIPGASASLVAMSEDMGADAIAVAVLQCLRIVMVSVTMPIIASFYVPDVNVISIAGVEQPEIFTSLPLPINVFILAIVAVVSIKVGERIKLPSHLFLAPFFSCLIFINLFPYHIYLPHSFFCGGLLLLGLSIGVKFKAEALRKLSKALLIEVFLILLLIASCFMAGYEFHLITKIDTLTALLGSTPGALSAMMATVIELGGNSSLVLAMQMTRMLLILTLCPIFAGILLKD